MTKDEALRLALEAFNDLAAWNDGEIGGHMDEPYSAEIARKVITAIKEALANEALDKMAENARELGLDYEPEQDWIERERAVGYREGHQNALKQMAQPEQEPVAWAKFSAKGNIIDLLSEPDDDYTPLYTTPPQRTWVGLTDEEKKSFWTADQMTQEEWDELFNTIEAKLKDKNVQR
jgi:hypothetical protein